MSKELVEAIVDMREEDALELAERLLKGGTSPLVILDDCREAMTVVGKRFECGEAFVPELMLAGEMLGQISAKVKPYLAAQTGEQTKLGRVIIGTVEGDIHDIGKDIVTFMLDVNGFDVQDLGVDVPAAKFVEAVQSSGAPVVGLSGLLTISFDSMKATVEALEAAGLRSGLKVMIGGGPVTEQVRAYAGADAVGADAQAAVALVNGWMETKEAA